MLFRSMHVLTHTNTLTGVVAGFQWATSAGPLCEEPMWGIAFELDARLILPAKYVGWV